MGSTRSSRDCEEISFSSKYCVKELLGEGATSSVHRIEDINTGESFACKIIKIDEDTIDTDGLTVTEKTLKEIKILKLVGGHENVIRFHGYFQTARTFYLIFEYCPAGELFDVLQACGALQEDKAAQYFSQLCLAVRHCHTLGVVHRDVKLENVLIGEDGKIRLTDFGYAEILRPGERLYGICGTAKYLAPEVWKTGMYEKHHCEGYSFEADVWACGVSLYTMITGNFPFEARRHILLMRQIRDCKLYYDNKMSESTRDLLNRILTVDVEKRISIEEVLSHKSLNPSVNDKLDDLSLNIEGLEIIQKTENIYHNCILASAS